MSSLQPQDSPSQPPMQSSIRASSDGRRPFSKYVLPVLNLDHEGPNSERMGESLTDDAGTIPSPRDTDPSRPMKLDSNRSWIPQMDKQESSGRAQHQRALPTSHDRRSTDPSETYQSENMPGQRPLPELPGSASRPGSAFSMDTTSRAETSPHYHNYSHAPKSTPPNATIQRPSISINPNMTGFSSLSPGDSRTDSYLSPPNSAHANDKATSSNQSVFPWLNRSRPKSPNMLGLGRPLEQGSIAMTKTKSKEKAKGKTKIGEEDGSFKVKAFRHVSSGSGVPPWEVQFDFEGIQPPTAPTPNRSESEPVVPQRSNPRRDVPASPSSQTENVSGRRPGGQMSRPPSVTGSINQDETPRQVSVQRFKQTRRYSGISLNGDNGFASHDQLPYRSDGQGHTRVKSDSSGVEVLVSPQKRRAAGRDSDNSDEEVLASSHVNGNDLDQYLASRPMNRSFSTSALSVDSPVDRPGLKATESSSATRRSLDQGYSKQAPGIVSHTPRRPSGFAVQNRRAVSVFDESPKTFAHDDRRIESQTQHRPFGHDRSRSASGIHDLAAEISHTKPLSNGVVTSGSRPPLRERLASLALSTPPVTDLPLAASPECEIPPVPLDSPETSNAQTVIARPASAQPLHNARPSAQQRSSSAISSNRQKVRTGWDDSSSDDESDAEKKPIRKPRTASVASAPLPAFKGQSLPSGLRRPPAPSEAFGPDEDDSPKRTSLAGSQGSRSSSFSSDRGPLPSSFQRAKSSSHQRATSNALVDSESDSSDSSEDEPLMAIKHRQSSSSLASGASFTTRTKAPSQTSSPAKSLRSNSNSNLPPLNTNQNISRSPMSNSPLSTVPATMSTMQRSSQLPSNSTVPRPPSTLVTAGLHKHESPASSQSGATTGDTSSGGLPVTPRELSMALNNPIAVRSTRSSFSSTQLANPRRVSFAEHDRGYSVRNVEEDAEKEQVKKTNERRREEARKATEIGHAANGNQDQDENPMQNPAQYLQHLQSQMPQFGQITNTFNPYFGMPQPGFMDPTQQMYILQMQMAQMAQMNPAMMQMQQQAMVLAKQQYQAAMVAAAMQAAEDAWERGSTMTGLGSTTGRNPIAMAQMPPANSNFGMGMPGMFGMMPAFDSAGSVYGGNSSPHAPLPQQNNFAVPRPAASVYGDSLRPHVASNDQPRPNRSRSSPSLDKLMTEHLPGPSGRRHSEQQTLLNQQRPLPLPTTRRPQPKSMIPTKGPDNEILQINNIQHYSSAAPSGAAVPPSTWKTRSTGDRIR
ncbi:hypothetical protein QFC19_007132 [Naganishia cerealis]|uniref:Uncharacterized protein n=1 Tax=Naganishia cerealis TaxID=610337 RepID=A0ACC2VC84_9TREE|nr:hypothetical protein QFC19_007132 [Naganishia cerealis]